MHGVLGIGWWGGRWRKALNFCCMRGWIEGFFALENRVFDSASRRYSGSARGFCRKYGKIFRFECKKWRISRRSSSSLPPLLLILAHFLAQSDKLRRAGIERG